MSFSEQLTKGAIGLLFIVIAIVLLPTMLLDGLVSQRSFSQFRILEDLDYTYVITDGTIRLEVTNNTDEYWENVAARFVFFDRLGLPITDRKERAIKVDLDIGQLRPGESRTVLSGPIPKDATSAQLLAGRQKKVRT